MTLAASSGLHKSASNLNQFFLEMNEKEKNGKQSYYGNQVNLNRCIDNYIEKTFWSTYNYIL